MTPTQARRSSRGPRAHRGLTAILLLPALLVALMVACAGRTEIRPLPAAPDLEPNRLVILVHGYISEAGAFTPLYDQLYRDGVPRDWIEPGAPGYAHYHTHSFDFGRFTRVGSGHNLSIEDLAEGMGLFYHSLPDSCPICRERANRPVEVTFVARSAGGIVVREFLLAESDRQLLLSDQVPGEATVASPWKIGRVITLGTPFYGSFKTLYSRGFLSVLINGGIRTVLFGFLGDNMGGTFGAVIDAQVRALRFGSLYLWRAHHRYTALLERLASRGRTPPPWLSVISVGHHKPEKSGDYVTRFPAANLAATTPQANLQTYIANLRHTRTFHEVETGWRGREQDRLARAITTFIERGTLKGDPGGAFKAWQITRAGELRADDGRHHPEDLQRVFLQRPPEGELESGDMAHKMKRLSRFLGADQGDVWLRFYDGEPGIGTPQVLPLRRSLSYFRNGVERSRSWTDLVAYREADAMGESIPTVHALGYARSHLITIPDVTPTGPYNLAVKIWIKGQVPAQAVPAELVRVVVEGSPDQSAPWDREPWQIPLRLQPYRANLIHVYLNGAEVRRLYPGVDVLDIRQVQLEPAPFAAAGPLPSPSVVQVP